MGVKFGKALGAEVTVLSTSPAKKEAVMRLGADHFIISREKMDRKAAFKIFDFGLDTVSGNSDVNPYLAILKSNGIYVNVGMPAKPWEVSSFSLATGNKVIAGFGAGEFNCAGVSLDTREARAPAVSFYVW